MNMPKMPSMPSMPKMNFKMPNMPTAYDVQMGSFIKLVVLAYMIISVMIISPFKIVKMFNAELKDKDMTGKENKARKSIRDMYLTIGIFSIVSVLSVMGMTAMPAMKDKIMMFVALLTFINVILLIAIMAKLDEAGVRGSLESTVHTDMALTIVLVVILGKIAMENK